jgi:hypothetical protein
LLADCGAGAIGVRRYTLLIADGEEPMGDYVARVELHGVRRKEDYDHLHNQLKIGGFYALIVNAKGEGVPLPTGTYASYGNYTTIDLAHDAVRHAVITSGFGGSIVVVEFSQWRGSSL